jgi:hypothetical protein
LLHAAIGASSPRWIKQRMDRDFEKSFAADTTCNQDIGREQHEALNVDGMSRMNRQSSIA